MPERYENMTSEQKKKRKEEDEELEQGEHVSGY
jgi:hypothetical protein